MGLTVGSVGKKATQTNVRAKSNDLTVLLAGTPNVGKSTVFNALTGLHQHTGNWSGKTVTGSIGFFTAGNRQIALVDLPGTYSLYPSSAEESVATDSLCFDKYDCTVVVCDATTLSKSLTLVYQVLEITSKIVICLNLIDQAEKKNIEIDAQKIEQRLHVPVVMTSARSKKGLSLLTEKILEVSSRKEQLPPAFKYDGKVEEALDKIKVRHKPLSRFIKAQLLFSDKNDAEKITNKLSLSAPQLEELDKSLEAARKSLSHSDTDFSHLQENMSTALVYQAKECAENATCSKKRKDGIDRRLDRIFTGRLTGIPIMLFMMCLVFFITIYAANYPSAILSRVLFSLGELMRDFLDRIGTAQWITRPLIDGVWRVLAWVISVMLPPMAIFFPLFTLLEDFGYLPRMAFNLDACFKKCGSCGKQSLCMAMGFGCNAAGVVGCRIIDSPRERLIAVLTNSLVPCNGRFPTIIAIISMFFVSALVPSVKSVAAAGLLTCVILLSVAMTLAVSFALSKTLLKGKASSFVLELPSYRPPKPGSVIIRSIFDRTLFVLGRAISISAPMGLVIWLLANIKISGTAVITYFSDFLDPLGRLMGLDGVILLAFILGFPANEIVLPIVLMCYLSQGSLIEITDYGSIFAILSDNGWSTVTGICFILFSLMHFPCSTTLMTIKKETGSIKYTLLAFVLPTILGFVCCTLVSTFAKF